MAYYNQIIFLNEHSALRSSCTQSFLTYLNNNWFHIRGASTSPHNDLLNLMNNRLRHHHCTRTSVSGHTQEGSTVYWRKHYRNPIDLSGSLAANKCMLRFFLWYNPPPGRSFRFETHSLCSYKPPVPLCTTHFDTLAPFAPQYKPRLYSLPVCRYFCQCTTMHTI